MTVQRTYWYTHAKTPFGQLLAKLVPLYDELQEARAQTVNHEAWLDDIERPSRVYFVVSAVYGDPHKSMRIEYAAIAQRLQEIGARLEGEGRHDVSDYSVHVHASYHLQEIDGRMCLISELSHASGTSGQICGTETQSPSDAHEHVDGRVSIEKIKHAYELRSL